MLQVNAGRPRWIDFIVEVFGSLIPGLVFVAALSLIAAWPVATLIQMCEVSPGAPVVAAPTLLSKELSGSLSIEILVILFCVAYVSGQIFFRQDPKVCDGDSVRRLFRKQRDSTPAALRKEFACDSADSCQFPYVHLAEYLKSRGLHHMLWFITWDDEGSFRTKIYINILKIRCAIEAPDAYGVVARNEAHVRLMSSTWYLARALMWLAGLIAAFYLVPVLLLRWHVIQSAGWNVAVPSLMRPLIPAGLVFVAAHLMRRSIEAAFHYQRLREIVFVIETANFVFKSKPELINDVFPEFGRCAAPVEPGQVGDPTARCSTPNAVRSNDGNGERRG